MKLIGNIFDTINNGFALSINLLVGQTAKPVYAKYSWC